ncbi:NERD domain-containing protein [Nocardia sp. NBC_00508]|uniref:NERD domain-containing protein n=1 Tax=Nocardia sp. NBC_00508 TaxID=2975992 RepID=UPI002E7FD791|nr:NERD domain-containing protein [Nocardia sp. NBC_00508]WUD64309.1 NERD domain-containing protein [Nocardia sp. NBC_00508]
MLVINERTTATRSERRVLGWLRSWTGQYVIVGVAISGCYLPDRKGDGEAQGADLVVITPRAAVVIEAKGTVPEAMTGVLSVQANGRWRLSGFEGDPIDVPDSDSSPFDQVTNNVSNLKELVRKHHPDTYVDGLIVVVPPRESTVTLNIESRRKGCGVVLGSTPAELRAWFHRTASRNLIWTAERAHAVLSDLNLVDQVSIEDLVADGFPLERALRGDAGAMVLEEAAPGGGTPSAENSDAACVPAHEDVPSSHSTRERPVAPQLNAPGSLQAPESDDAQDETAPASDRPVSPLAETPMPARSDALEAVSSDETAGSGPEGGQRVHSSPSSIADRQFDTAEGPEDDPEPVSTSDRLPPRLAQSKPAEPDPYTLEPAESPPSEPLPSGATVDFAAQSPPPLSSPFTDRWSSWIESDTQPLRPPATPSPLSSEPPWWSAADAEPRPPRRPTVPRLVERRPRIADLRHMITVPPRTRTRTADQPRPIRHRPQQIAAVALIALVIGTIWVLAAACSTPQGDAVQQTPSPASTTEPPPPTEVAPPPPTVTETPARFDLLPLCLPFRSDC